MRAECSAVTTHDGQITTRLRLFNGGDVALTITSEDICLALSYAENPQGPRITAEGLTPFDLLPGQEAEVTLVWGWSGEPYGRLEVSAYRFALQS